MRQKKLKKLLHNRDKQKNLQNKNNETDSRLHIIRAHISDILNQSNRASTFAQLRKRVIENELNKYLHPNSNHIRLKPYYDSGKWIKWIGVLGDVTLPNQTKKGSLLIDKISVGNLPEIIDYHAWLNVENIKAIDVDRLPLAIGDYIIGFSKVKKYDQNKYGLAQTFILDAGQFVEKRIESTYDRQDSWVVELTNNELTTKTKNTVVDTKKNSDNEVISKIQTVLENASGHVDDRYQPTRYQKFQERLKKLNLSESDDILPLISKNKHTYIAKVVQSHIVDLPKATHKMPQLEIKDVIDVASGRLVFASCHLPYIPDLKVLGELKRDEVISFDSQPLPGKANAFGLVTNFKLVDSDSSREFIPLPKSLNTFLGYIMWKHPEEGSESEYIASYQNWAKNKQIHQGQIDSELSSVRPIGPITEFDLAQKLNVKPELISDARRQGIIAPTVKGSLTVRYDPEAWDTMREIIGAQDNAAIDFLRKIYPIYTINDLVKKSGLTRDEVERKINAEKYLSLNGLHCRINIYGPKVLDILQAKKSIQDLLPKNTKVAVVKREIPRDKSVPVITEKEESTSKTKLSTPKEESDKNNKLSDNMKVNDDDLLKQNEKPEAGIQDKKENAKVSEKLEQSDNAENTKENRRVKFVHRTSRNYKELAKKIIQHQKQEDLKEKSISKSADDLIRKENNLLKEPSNLEEAEKNDKSAMTDEVVLTLIDGSKYLYTFFDAYQEKIEEIQKQAQNPMSNLLIKVLNLETKEYEYISVKGILKIQNKRM